VVVSDQSNHTSGVVDVSGVVLGQNVCLDLGPCLENLMGLTVSPFSKEVRRVVMVGHECVSCTVQETPLVNSMQLYASDDKYEDFKQLVARALNTWDTAPQWLVDLDHMLTGTPKPGDMGEMPKKVAKDTLGS
jgi:hypothetical protein